MSDSWLKPSAGRILLRVKVIPGAARTAIGGMRDGLLLARIAAQPEKGKANELLVAELARILGLPKGQIVLVAGALARRKVLSLPPSVEAALRALAVLSE